MQEATQSPARDIAFIGTGRTIASIGKDAFDLLDYGHNDKRLSADEVIASLPHDERIARIRSISFKAIDSVAISSVAYCSAERCMIRHGPPSCLHDSSLGAVHPDADPRAA